MARLYNFYQHYDKRGWLIPAHEVFDNLGYLRGIPFKTCPVTAEKFCEQFRKHFREAVDAAWDHGKHHIVMHSSGYDSRILGSVLKRGVYNDILFVCMEPEFDYFRPIFEYYDIAGAHALQAKRLGKYGDARSCNKANDFSAAVLRGVAELGVPKDEVQVFTCGYFNELLSYGFFEKYGSRVIPPTASLPLTQFVETYYLYAPYAKNAAEPGVEMVYPILGDKPLATILSSQIKLDDEIRKQILRDGDPELYAFTRYQDAE
jgi:hypothetical protein